MTRRAAAGRRPWPWPADTVLDRTRRVALSYRAALEAAHPEAAADIDRWAIDHGQGWVVPAEFPYTENDLLTRQQVADVCYIDLRTVYSWHRRGLAYTDTPDGIRVRVGDLFLFQRSRRLARLPNR